MAQATSFEAGMIARSDALVATLARAADYAAGQGQPSITLEHLLLALTEDGDAAGVLTASNVDLHRLRNEVAGFIGQQSPAAPIRTSPVPDAELTKILTYAEAAARQSRRTEINGAIVLAAILGEGRSMAATFLKAQGLTFQAAIKIIQQVLAPTPPPATTPRSEPEPAAPSAAEPPGETSAAASAMPAPEEVPRDDYIAPPPRTPPPAEPITRVPIPEVQRPQREVLGIPSIRPDPPPRPPAPAPAPRQQAPRAAEPREEPPPTAQPVAREPEPKSTAPAAPAAPTPVPAAPAASSRPSPVPPRPDVASRAPATPAPAAPPAPAPSPTALEEPRRPAPSAGDPVPPRAPVSPQPAAQSEERPSLAKRSQYGEQPVPPSSATIRPPPLPPREPVRDPARPAAGPPPIPPTRPIEPPHAGSAHPPSGEPSPPPSGLGAPRPAPPRPGMRLPQNPLEGHQITAPWPEPTNDYRPPVPPPAYPPHPPAARAPQHQPDLRATRDGSPQVQRPLPPSAGRAPAVEKGQLVENIPRRMKVGVAETFEVRIAREGVMEVGQGLPGRADPQFHAIRITRAMSVRLKGEPGRFYIEASSPETQWTGTQNERLAGDYAVWRFTVIPQMRGAAELTLIVAARSIGTDGVVADTSLPEQRITVRVSANMTRGLKRWLGWISVAVLGGILAKLGEAFWEPALAIIRRVLSM